MFMYVYAKNIFWAFYWLKKNGQKALDSIIIVK